jgi:hypothetical protein
MAVFQKVFGKDHKRYLREREGEVREEGIRIGIN